MIVLAHYVAEPIPQCLCIRRSKSFQFRCTARYDCLVVSAVAVRVTGRKYVPVLKSSGM